MNPVHTEQVQFTPSGSTKPKTILLGFTTYRVVPFFGVDTSKTSVQETLIMPQDDFILKHGGIGFGSASTTVKDQTVDTAIFSFGGFHTDQTQKAL